MLEFHQFKDQDWIEMLARMIVMVLAMSWSGSAIAGKRIALVIGNQDYKRGVGKLVNPFNDIRIVGEALRKVGFDVLKPVRNATRADMLDALDDYVSNISKAGPDAVGFIYYSGHGIASRGKNYLIPVELEKPSTKLLRSYGLEQAKILDILQTEAPRAAHYFVIDACRNVLQGARGAKGFVPVDQQVGTLIAFATAPGKTASDVGDRSGPYAKALAAELVKPGVTDLQMFSNVRYAVSRASGGDQVPWTLDGIVRQKRMMFGGLLKPIASRSSVAAKAWNVIKDTKNLKKLRAFAQRFSGTVYGQVAELTADNLAANRTANANAPSKRGTTIEVAALPSSAIAQQERKPNDRTVPTSNDELQEKKSLDLTRKIQSQLKRLRCLNGLVDGKWGAGSKLALSKFNKYAGLNLNTELLTSATLAALGQQTSSICPGKPVTNPTASKKTKSKKTTTKQRASRKSVSGRCRRETPRECMSRLKDQGVGYGRGDACRSGARRRLICR